MFAIGGGVPHGAEITAPVDEPSLAWVEVPVLWAAASAVRLQNEKRPPAAKEGGRGLSIKRDYFEQQALGASHALGCSQPFAAALPPQQEAQSSPQHAAQLSPQQPSQATQEARQSAFELAFGAEGPTIAAANTLYARRFANMKCPFRTCNWFNLKTNVLDDPGPRRLVAGSPRRRQRVPKCNRRVRNGLHDPDAEPGAGLSCPRRVRAGAGGGCQTCRGSAGHKGTPGRR